MAAWLIVVGIAALLGFSAFLYLVFDPVFTEIISMTNSLINDASAGQDIASQSLGIFELIIHYWPVVVILVALVYGTNKALNESRRGM